MGGDNPACDDQFHNNMSGMMDLSCMSGRKGREGLFPADSCVKIRGKFGNYKSELSIQISVWGVTKVRLRGISA